MLRLGAECTDQTIHFFLASYPNLNEHAPDDPEKVERATDSEGNMRKAVLVSALLASTVALATGARAAAQNAVTPRTSAPQPVQPPAADPGPASAESESEQKRSEIVVTGRFVDPGASSALKMGVPVRDVPFSTDTYTNSFLKAINTTQVADLYRYMTGVQKAGATGYDLNLRGFTTGGLDRNTIMVDGLPGLSVRFGSPPTVGTESIALVKGAQSLLYGAVQPGGFVNIITKKPRSDGFTEISVLGTIGASHYPRTRGIEGSIDSTGRINQDGTLLYRAIGEVSYGRQFRDRSFENTIFFAPSLTWKPGPGTTITTSFEYRYTDTNYATFYLVAPRGAVASTVAALAPIHTNYIAPGNFLREKGYTGSLFVRQDLGRGASLNFSFRGVKHRDWASVFDIGPFDRTDPTNGTLDLRARQQDNHRDYGFADLNVIVPFETGGIRHKVITGVNLGREVDDFRKIQYCDIAAPGRPTSDPSCQIPGRQFTVSVINPNFSNLPPVSAFGLGRIATAAARDWQHIVATAEGAYFSDFITLSDHFKALAGVRYAREIQSNILNRYIPGDPEHKQTFQRWLPQAGLIFEPSHQVSIYASYSTSFSPVNLSNTPLTSTPVFKPTTGIGLEAGVKLELLHGTVSVTGAVFKIDQKNVLAPYPGTDLVLCPSRNCQIQVGGARSKGVELEVNAHPLPNWTVTAGYAHTEAIITESTAGGPLVGHALPNAPRDSFQAFTRYDVASGPLSGWGIGLGASVIGSRIANTATSAVPGEFVLPSYAVVDLAIYKSFSRNVDATIKVSNLFDKTYYNSASVVQGLINVQPGTPRIVQLNVRVRF
jgi:iron complex outermembrane receptor protein